MPYRMVESQDQGVDSEQAAKHVLDPTGLLGSGETSLKTTPQFCQQYEWQLQDK